MEAEEWTVSIGSGFVSTRELTQCLSHMMQLCKELLRFLYSLDRSGVILRAALSEGQSAQMNLLRRVSSLQAELLFSHRSSSAAGISSIR